MTFNPFILILKFLVKKQFEHKAPYTKTEQQEQQQGENTKNKKTIRSLKRSSIICFLFPNADARAEHIYLQLIIPPSIINRCIRPSAARALDFSHPTLCGGGSYPFVRSEERGQCVLLSQVTLIQGLLSYPLHSD